MNTKLAIILALASTGAYAQFPVGVAPGNPGAQVVPTATAPKLSAPEQGAFKALEVATQLVESRIVQKGCTPISFKTTVDADEYGNTTATIGAVGALNPVVFNVVYVSSKANFGRIYAVSGPGGQLNGTTIADITGQGSYNIGSSIQELSTFWKASSPTTGSLDNFKGTVIKDYARLPADAAVTIPAGFDDAGAVLLSPVINYGYQQVTKYGYVQAKYWQQSLAWRYDGVNGGTFWYKTKAAGKNNCDIEVRLQGDANDTDFNQTGTIAVVGKTDVGVTAAGKTAK